MGVETSCADAIGRPNEGDKVVGPRRKCGGVRGDLGNAFVLSSENSFEGAKV